MRSSVVGSHQNQHPPPETTSHSPNVNLDLSPEKQKAQNDVLQNAVFPNWRDDTGGADLDKPDEMAKMDPLGTQMWKLYSKQKKTMPNSERVENLSWRLMSVKLKNMKSDAALRCVSEHTLVFSSRARRKTDWLLSCPANNAQALPLASLNCGKTPSLPQSR